LSLLRLTQKELERLGRDARSQAAAALPGKDARPRKPGKPDGGVPAKGGRLARRHYDGPAVVVELDLAPRPKERARTFVDQGALCRAFVAAHGDVRRFMALIKPKSLGGDREGGLMRTVTPEDTRHYEEAVRLLVGRAIATAGMAPFTCPLQVVVDFRFLGDPGTWPTAQDDGDLDNLLKAVFDGMNKVAYSDDRLLVRQKADKRCADRDGITVSVSPAEP